MRWRGRRQSSNMEDHRFDAPVGGVGGIGRLGGLGGGGGGLLRLLPLLFRVLGPKGTLLAALALGAWMFFGGGDLGSLLGGGGVATRPAATQTGGKASAAEQEQVAFVKTVLADTEDTWHALFRQADKAYREPTVVLYRGAVRSACGLGQAAMGPFYCPGDRKVYLDLGFFDELARRHGAPGDFAQAYVIAHEIGHHVQNLLGISGKVHQARQRVGKVEGNRLSVRLELQADCYAGVWAYHASRSRQLLEAGDIEEGLTAANAIGDDRLQREATGRVSPDAFTHGSSEQRMRWFTRGYEQGSFTACDTFGRDVRL
ncbi:KPN_02809 family neutral zinc metallopeptidase [endosymbiont of unidentified scaly snail isolate Monju]|uniref:KPN_02809 family neutral zinc metallopeptidase n=1 Tax=endosymbiont of unidentified scaly snail isolate Monju TaxID=1248727 RepID=UPI0003892464|nr:neutral zinc metallopeptidase [endosymbiont of unidentified scaly snail isolate Monju]BAN70018.1 zinc metalloprotease [endosymbiont of unidentified scaly snail isolate Monju]